MIISVVVACYIFLALATLGYLIRHSRAGRVRQVAAAAAWPIYWPIYHGLTASYLLIEPVIMGVYLLGAFFFPAFYLYFHWAGCEGPGCVGTVAKSLLWALFWPAYLLASML